MILKKLEHATVVDTSDLVTKKYFIDLKPEADKLDINKLVNVRTSLNNITTKVDDLDVGTLKIFVAALKKLSHVVLIGYLDKFLKTLVLILHKMSGYAKTFKVKGRDKGKNNRLMSFQINHKKLLEKYKIIWTTIEEC